MCPENVAHVMGPEVAFCLQMRLQAECRDNVQLSYGTGDA